MIFDLFTLSSSNDTSKVIAFESATDNLQALSTDYALDLTPSAKAREESCTIENPASDRKTH